MCRYAAALSEMGMKGSGNFLDTGLTRLLETTEIVDASASGQSTEPLMIDEDGGFVYVKGIGSEGKVMTADIPACNGLVHTVDTVLLPLLRCRAQGRLVTVVHFSHRAVHVIAKAGFVLVE